ncbi:MAG TPA: PGPGW domain-containing protein [Opitutaceae bacterium]|nr:PGPGW domain-containing protein [Opitutaceae bacterium]
MVTASLKKNFREIKKGRPGHRFQDYYKREHRAHRRHRSRGRIWRLVIGILSILVGIILCVIPGPGLPFIFIGGGLLATESLFVARIMDWLEVRAQAVRRWAMRHWKAMPLWGRIIVGVIFVSGSVGSMVLFYRLMHS